MSKVTSALLRGDFMRREEYSLPVEELAIEPARSQSNVQQALPAENSGQDSIIDHDEGRDRGESGNLDANGIDALYASRREPIVSRKGTIVIVACLVMLVALTIFGSVLNVGDHLFAAHPALGWAFYALFGVVVILGVVMPVVKVAQHPIFSLYQLRDEKGRAKQKWCRMLADNLIKNTKLTPDEVKQIELALTQGDKADDLLIDFFNKHCVPKIDAETKRAASTAFFISAVSRSPLISTVTMLSVCLDLVRGIVEICGFRPTNFGLARLYSRVMLSALIIGGIEDSDLSDLLGQLMGGGAGARAGGIVIGATAEGLVSAFLVFRVGVLTKKWLTAEDGPISMRAARRTSYREALSLMRTSDFMQTVTDTVKQTTGAVASNMASAVKEKTDTVASSVADTVSHAARSTVQNAKSKMAAAKDALSSSFR